MGLWMGLERDFKVIFDSVMREGVEMGLTI